MLQIPPFVLGLVAVPLAKRVVKPLVRGVVKASIELAMDVRRTAHAVGEEFQDLAAEAAAEVAAAEMVDAGAATENKTSAGDKARQTSTKAR